MYRNHLAAIGSLALASMSLVSMACVLPPIPVDGLDGMSTRRRPVRRQLRSHRGKRGTGLPKRKTNMVRLSRRVRRRHRRAA